ncbi:uncharacterized protein ACLA_093250 [Aspergillus clavatus NRRL 1]|uniref:Aminodeoxychorismate lyase n=1 Tax=Aspergillus clavatus (strain ATCC 1007 / CBS 513.65 / DSM 816 / NCTC 3887 / NRRL 1 / QM 1276 / 107) TaxID=344612 RepID=A1CFH7_ASPCL|nr:uncharacterized protein ACLA_093250 [Aspergillus clavatus NRRL 1]EAW11626.1 conserved hypothetical protein [Aspergillus clavatus NRRL 1]
MASDPPSLPLPEETFQIISSLRYEPALPEVIKTSAAECYPDSLQSPFYLLPYHQQRLLSAAECFKWTEAVAFLQQDLKSFAQFLDGFIPDQTKPWRLRIVVDRHGRCTVDVNPAMPMEPLSLLLPSDKRPPSDPWRVVVDSQPTIPSPFTRYKTTSRNNYTAARLRSNITSPQDPVEVLIVNPNGQIMEGSITTPYFRRRGHGSQPEGNGQNSSEPTWVTPPLSSGGNAGTTRRYALAQRFCSEQAITVGDLIDGEECWLSNGVRGFFPGKIVISEPK